MPEAIIVGVNHPKNNLRNKIVALRPDSAYPQKKVNYF